ncbi:MAG: glycosyltransferase family 39 protein [Clostridiales bacterium]|nr:glycosyltransferase family 39 protein [Clostridiales bacterium]
MEPLYNENGKINLRSLFTFSDKTKNPKLTRADSILLCFLTGIYLIVALLNLGTLNFPTSVWTQTQGESVVLDFGAEVEIASYWVNPNIGESNGEFTLTADDGTVVTFVQRNESISPGIDGKMFKWHDTAWGVTTRTLQLDVSVGLVAINEIAFKDAAGNVLPVFAHTDEALPNALIDEQGTVPEASTYFNSMYFDEVYHGRTAYEGMNGMYLYEWTHPPLGKEIISIGIMIFGMVPFGWRIMGTLFGAAMIPLIYVFAKRIFKRTDFAFVAAAFIAVDCMHFAQTRIATIDTFGVFFILLMFFYMYEWMNLSFYDVPFRKTIKPLALSGLFFGLGSASKWIGFYAGAGLAVLLFITLGMRLAEYASARGKDARARTKYGLGKIIGTIALCIPFFIIIPAIIYFASYYPYFIYDGRKAVGDYGFRGMFDTMWRNQNSMFSYHSGLDATHPCQSPWYSWPISWRSMWFSFRSFSVFTPGGREIQMVSNISSTGNPFLFLGGTIGALSLLICRGTGQVKRSNATLMFLIAILANFLPWVFVTRAVFIYHFFATVPFLLLASLYLLQNIEERRPKYARIKWVLLIAAAIYFVLMYPAISGLPMPRWYAWILEYVPDYLLLSGNMFYGAV